MSAAARSLGDFPVSVGAEAVAAFAAALGRIAPGGPVPMTYPLRWLAEPDIRAALTAVALAEGDDILPVHVEQRIDLSEPLQIGATYRLSLSVEGPDTRRILRVSGRWHDADGRVAGSLSTGLLLVPTRGAAA